MSRSEAPALVIEKNRLKKIGGSFLGIEGDPKHSFGYHLAASELPGDDYSMSGRNRPIKSTSACCAIDIGMDWKASRKWLAWLITSIRERRITGVAEVIGSFNGRDVRYWSATETPGWQQNGVPYTGEGHDTWTHVSIYRSDVTTDRGILAGWTGTGHDGGDDDMPKYVALNTKNPVVIEGNRWYWMYYDIETSDKNKQHGDNGLFPTVLAANNTHRCFSATTALEVHDAPPGLTVQVRAAEVEKQKDGSYKEIGVFGLGEYTTTDARTFVFHPSNGRIGAKDKTRRLRFRYMIQAPGHFTVKPSRMDLLYWETAG